MPGRLVGLRDALGKILAMATSVEERRTQFRWMDKLSDEDVTGCPSPSRARDSADLDEYVDATSPKRGRVISLEGERVPVGGVYIVKSASPPELSGAHRRSNQVTSDSLWAWKLLSRRRKTSPSSSASMVIARSR